MNDFHPGRIEMTKDAAGLIAQPQRIEIRIDGNWVHFRELDTTGDAQVQTIPASYVQQIFWTWPTGRT